MAIRNNTYINLIKYKIFSRKLSLTAGRAKSFLNVLGTAKKLSNPGIFINEEGK